MEEEEEGEQEEEEVEEEEGEEEGDQAYSSQSFWPAAARGHLSLSSHTIWIYKSSTRLKRKKFLTALKLQRMILVFSDYMAYL